MKYTFLTIALAAIFMSCGSEATNEGTETSHGSASEETIAADAEIDPVCDMVRGDDWDEYSVSGEDTTWFCSHVCKGAYEARPEKYNKEG